MERTRNRARGQPGASRPRAARSRRRSPGRAPAWSCSAVLDELGSPPCWRSAAALFYVVVYTMVLKRRTPQNIVIGGAAGAIPPLVGWAAVTGGVEPGRR